MELDYKILKHEYMSICGSALLKVIQNNNLPILDLLTREAIQNSLDAKLPNVNHVEVDIHIGKFDSCALTTRLKPIGEQIEEKYHGKERNSYISFSDKNTTGLTGPITKNEIVDREYGKFLNLVFHIGKPQTVEGSGGSWGYGKTMYYRVGIGLVLFYTRIKENNEYQSRLILAFIEDEKDTIIPFASEEEKNKTGIMWFGKMKQNDIYPVTDEKEIEELLDIFHISPYDKEETGTTIVIPYIDEKELLENTYYSNNQEEANKPEWCDSIEKYIKVAVQRWYAPRLMNVNYKDNPYLKLYVNGNLFHPMDDFLPLFKVIQELYNASSLDSNRKIGKEEIQLRDCFENGAIAGTILYTKMTKEELGMPIEVSPYIQIANHNDFATHLSNPPIITFCRKPGMLIKYDIKEAWSNRIEHNQTDEYIIGLFVANSNRIIKQKNNKQITLEEYLRESEKADHANWSDLSDYNIVKKIQNHVQAKINAKFVIKASNPIKGIHTKLNKNLTSMFLPTVGFGKRANAKKKKGASKGEKEIITLPKFRSHLEFLDGTLQRNNVSNTISKDFILYFHKKDLRLSYEFAIISEDDSILEKQWEEKVGKKEFPIEIIKMELLTKQTKEKVEYVKKAMVNHLTEQYQDEQVKLSKRYTQNGKWIGWNITIDDENPLSFVRGRLTYQYKDNKYSCKIARA